MKYIGYCVNSTTNDNMRVWSSSEGRYSYSVISKSDFDKLNELMKSYFDMPMVNYDEEYLEVTIQKHPHLGAGGVSSIPLG